MNDVLSTWGWLPHAVEGVMAFTVLEVLLLSGYHRATGRGVPPREFVLNAISGLCLMLALRAAMVGSPVPWVALMLLLAGMVHGADLYRRWRRA